MSTMLLDTSSLMYRAFFALPQTIRDAQGRPVNAVHGYLDMTARLLTTRGPGRLVHVLDAEIRPAERVAAYPAYKAQRAPDPEALPPQFELLHRTLSALGEETASAPGWEADDAIGALCAAASADDSMEIVTGDRDLLALVCDRAPRVRVLFTVRGVSELAEFDEQAVRARYGVMPARYTEYAMLRGDPSDGLPGVPGVGEKTAARLVNAYPSLQALLADLEAQPTKLAERLDTARDYLEQMRQVVPVRADVQVELNTGQCDEDALAALAERGGLGGPLRRLAEARQALRP